MGNREWALRYVLLAEDYSGQGIGPVILSETKDLSGFRTIPFIATKIDRRNDEDKGTSASPSDPETD